MRRMFWFGLCLVMTGLLVTACGGGDASGPSGDPGDDPHDDPPEIPDTLFAAARDYATGMETTGLCLFQADGDGLPDLAFGSPDREHLFWALGDGEGGFGARDSCYAFAGNVSVCSADFDQDGHTDLATLATHVDSLVLLSGDGTGAFQISQRTSTYWDAVTVCTGDFDGDAFPDLAVANWLSDAIGVYSNEGQGIGLPTPYEAGNGPESMGAWDLDGDGDDDLVSCQSYSKDVAVLICRGDGTFDESVLYVTNATNMAVGAGDLDGDGVLDLAVGAANGWVYTFTGVGDGSFSAGPSCCGGSDVRGLLARDLDGDGDIDIATADRHDHRVALLLNNGDGTFQDPRQHGARFFATGQQPNKIAACDLDGDGDLDLITANAGASVSVLLNRLVE